MEQFLQCFTTWPALPAFWLLGLICVYWVLMLLGAVDLDFLDFDLDLDLDVDADPSALYLGLAPLRFLNISSVPTMLWLSVFALVCGMISQFWTPPAPHAEFIWPGDLFAVLRNFVVASLVTKVMTQPLRGRFDVKEPNRSEELIGEVCTVTTSEVSATFGEAELQREGAPLRLTVRTEDAEVSKGDRVEIVGFSKEDNTFQVRQA